MRQVGLLMGTLASASVGRRAGKLLEPLVLGRPAFCVTWGLGFRDCAYLASASRHECDVLGDSGRASTTQACGKGPLDFWVWFRASGCKRKGLYSLGFRVSERYALLLSLGLRVLGFAEISYGDPGSRARAPCQDLWHPAMGPPGGPLTTFHRILQCQQDLRT